MGRFDRTRKINPQHPNDTSGPCPPRHRPNATDHYSGHTYDKGRRRLIGLRGNRPYRHARQGRFHHSRPQEESISWSKIRITWSSCNECRLNRHSQWFVSKTRRNRIRDAALRRGSNNETTASRNAHRFFSPRNKHKIPTH